MAWSPRVLIVDDEVILAEALRDIVEQLGARVTATAHDYAAAVHLLTGTPEIDLAFIDLRLGDAMTGVELARQAAARGIQVVAMTGYSTLPDELAGTSLLTKPFSVETVRLLFDMLRRSRGRWASIRPAS